MKSIVFLRYDLCCWAIGWSSLSAKFDSLSLGPSQPEMIGPLTGFGLYVFKKSRFLVGCKFGRAIFSSYHQGFYFCGAV